MIVYTLLLQPQRTHVVERDSATAFISLARLTPQALARVLRGRVRAETRRFYDCVPCTQTL